VTGVDVLNALTAVFILMVGTSILNAILLDARSKRGCNCCATTTYLISFVTCVDTLAGT
jgi:hypothetical protein